jgi:protein gp37
MGDKSAIEWTDATWNPVRGCAIVSKGCTNCYAMKQAHRSSGPGGAYEGLTKMSKGGPVWTGEIRTVPELLDQPLRWRRPRRIFVNSMSDLFHELVYFHHISRIWKTMASAPQHTFQILTKRPERMLEWFGKLSFEHNTIRGPGDEAPLVIGHVDDWPLRNVWLGVSVEDQAAADERIPLLLQTPAAVRWISAEPLLGPVEIFSKATGDLRYGSGDPYNPGSIDWIVAGGESGPGARPMHPDWVRSLRDQCAAAHDGVPFFFKQWGNWVECECEVHADERGREATPITRIDGHRCEDEAMMERMGERGFRCCRQHGTEFVNVGKKIAGRTLDGHTHDGYPA